MLLSDERDPGAGGNSFCEVGDRVAAADGDVILLQHLAAQPRVLGGRSQCYDTLVQRFINGGITLSFKARTCIWDRAHQTYLPSFMINEPCSPTKLGTPVRMPRNCVSGGPTSIP